MQGRGLVSSFAFIPSLVLSAFLLAAPLQAPPRGAGTPQKQGTDKQGAQKSNPELERLRRERDDAEKALAGAVRELTDARLDLERIGLERERAEMSLAVVQGRIASLMPQYRALQTQSRGAKDRVDAAQTAVDAARKARGKALRDVNEAEAAKQQAIAAETARWEQSEPARALLDARASAGQRLTEAEAACLERLKPDRAYVSATETVAREESEVQRLRAQSPHDPAALSAASARWMEARNQLRLLESAAFDKDDPVCSAAAARDKAEADLKQAKERFEMGVASLPSVVQADLRLRTAEANGQAASDALEQAERALADTRSGADSVRCELVLVENEGRQHERAQAALQSEVNRLVRQFDGARTRYERASRNHADARSALKAARAKLEAAERAARDG